MVSHLKYMVLVMALAPLSLCGQQWEANFDDALQKSKTKNVTLILVFAGSDWCAPCIRLDKEIWQSADFKSYAKNNAILYKADFPRKRQNRLSPELSKQNGVLAERYNPNGFFPLVVALNGDGKVLGSTGYEKMTPNQYIKKLKGFIK